MPYFHPIQFYSKKGKLNSLRTEVFFQIGLIRHSLDIGIMDKDTEKQIEKIFKLFSEIFTTIIELMKMEKKFWNEDMFDEQFYLRDLRREILGIIDQIVNILDNKIKDLEQAKDNIEKVGRPLETIRINKLKDDVILMKEQLENMRVQFH